MNAHAVHGNKWAVIAKLLPMRTDNAIKNHWNSMLSRMPPDLWMPNSERYQTHSPMIRHASTKEELPLEEISSFTPLTLKLDDQMDDGAKEPLVNKCKYDVHRPVARMGAFSFYNTGSMNHHIAPCEGPLMIQATRPDLLASKFIQYLSYEPSISSKCARGCCDHPDNKRVSLSLLGPEFVDYEEHSSVELDKELIVLLTDLNNIAWMRSGINYSYCREVEQSMKADKFIRMVNNGRSSQMLRNDFRPLN